MGVLKHIEDHTEVVERGVTMISFEEIARARRFAKLLQVEGMWKDRTDIPDDGVVYQEEMRAE